MQSALTEWLRLSGYGIPVRSEPVAGGCINQTTRLYFADGATVFLKTNNSAADGMFRTEAMGLSSLADSRTLRVPNVIQAGSNFLLLEDLGETQPLPHYWEELGKGLAALHAKSQPGFGFVCDNYCGSTLQVNSRSVDGFEFFAELRIRRLARLAYQKGLLDYEELTALIAIADNLPRWVPDMPPVLIHGDLWCGNVHCDARGLPALIDPACYWGWAEAELAMTLLFGGFKDAFYAAYTEHSRLEPAWRERAPIYNLYHLLNHLVLFGASYRTQIQQVCTRFSPA